MTISQLPALNACLNALSAAFLILGFLCIKRGRRTAHRNAMLAALATSAAFLSSYLYYHWHAGATRFTGVGTVRTVYFAILISHTVLAAVVPVLVCLTVPPALRGNFLRHKRLATWTLPIWLYVSVTGVLIYLFLYRIYPAS